MFTLTLAGEEFHLPAWPGLAWPGAHDATEIQHLLVVSVSDGFREMSYVFLFFLAATGRKRFSAAVALQRRLDSLLTVAKKTQDVSSLPRWLTISNVLSLLLNVTPAQNMNTADRCGPVNGSVNPK